MLPDLGADTIRNFCTRLGHKISHTKLRLCPKTVSAADAFQAVNLSDSEIGFPVSDDHIWPRKLGGKAGKYLLFWAKSVVFTTKIAGKPPVQPEPPAVSLLIGTLAVGEEDQRVSLAPKLIQHSGNPIV